MREFVHEPINTRSIEMSSCGVPCLERHIFERPLEALAVLFVQAGGGSGTDP